MPKFRKTSLLYSLRIEELLKIIKEGKEYGTTTGRMRKVNWLNLNKLIEAINISGTTHIIISKIDVLERINLYKLYYNSNLVIFNTIEEMKQFISNILITYCKPILQSIEYSSTALNI